MPRSGMTNSMDSYVDFLKGCRKAAFFLSGMCGGFADFYEGFLGAQAFFS